MSVTIENSYVLVTAARNEEDYIEKTINAVCSQTVLPKKWVIVSDGSTDRTDEIVGKYATNYDYIQLLCLDAGNNRNFGSKVNAIRAGVELLNGLEYEFIGNLDADISFRPDYFQLLLEKLADNSKLGIVGGTILELQKGVYKPRVWNTTRSVPGAIQLFRCQCYEEIGGYIPIKVGGIDTAALVMAQLYGWQVESFPEIQVLHHRPTGTGALSIWRTRFHQGIIEYLLGYHPLYHLTKCLRRLMETPYLLGSLIRTCGYCWSSLKMDERPVSEDFVKFHRRKQRKIMKYTLLNTYQRIKSGLNSSNNHVN